MNYTTSNRLPEAYVSVGKNKNRLKIYNGNHVFIKDGEEFQIELFNPTTKTIGAKILINGNSISSSLLVLKPGERSYLERYLDDNKKFLFETYNVENSKEVKDAIRNNGDIKVEFYNEKAAIYVAPLNVVYPSYYYGGINYPYNPTITIGQPNLYFGSTGLSGNTGLSGSTGPVGLAGTSSTSIVNCNDTTNAFYCSTSPTFTSSGTVTTTSIDASVNTNLETGRIEKGAVSDQKLGNYYGEFESYSFSNKEYKLLPESQKPVEVKDIRQYCPGCRTRVKKASWKFCPSCGETLD